jgi:hypothetical protein
VFVAFAQRLGPMNSNPNEQPLSARILRHRCKAFDVKETVFFKWQFIGKGQNPRHSATTTNGRSRFGQTRQLLQTLAPIRIFAAPVDWQSPTAGPNSGVSENRLGGLYTLRLDDVRYFVWAELNTLKPARLSGLHSILQSTRRHIDRTGTQCFET